MKKINEILIVEGKHDIDFLSSFLDATFIKTDGTSLPTSTKDMLLEFARQGKQFIVLTDPDVPGEQIRRELASFLPSLRHAFVRKEFARTTKKVGVEHATREEVLRALQHQLTFGGQTGSLTLQDFYECGLTGQKESNQKREEVFATFHLGHGSAKTLLKRLNLLGITKEKLMTTMGWEYDSE